MNLVRKLLGRGQDAATSAMDQATPAARDPSAHLPHGAHAAASASAPATDADTAREDLSPEKLGEFQHAVDNLGADELQSATRQAVDQMPEDTRSSLFNLAQSYLEREGAPAPQSAAVASGDTDALSRTVTGLMKQGSGALGSLFGGAGASTGRATGGLADQAGDALGALGGDQTSGFASLLSNPLARQVLAFIVPAVLKAVSDR